MKKNKYEKRRDLKFFWNLNAPWSPSGYGQWTNKFVTEFVKDGWNTAMCAYYGLEGGEMDYKGIHVYPKMSSPWGDDAMVSHSKDYGAHVVMTHMDIWVLNPQFLQQIKHWIPYVPIDHAPVPGAVLDKLRFAYRILTFSKFGQKELEKHGFASTCIVQGTDVEIFKPMDKAAIRAKFGISPDTFLFGMVGANKDNRKGFDTALEAFKIFHDKHPNSALFIHSYVDQPGGFNIPEYAKFLGIEKSVMYLDPYRVIFKTKAAEVAEEMNMFDCLLQPSINEGFGVPVIEAQACGVPVIVNNWTSLPELVVPGKTGEIADYKMKKWDYGIGGYVAYCDVDSLVEKMEIIHSEERGSRSKACRDHIVENYNHKKQIKEQWIPYFEKLQDEILGTK